MVCCAVAFNAQNEISITVAFTYAKINEVTGNTDLGYCNQPHVLNYPGHC